MIDFLRTWITNVVVLIIFLTLVEIILPSNSMKKYARFIIGLIVIINILIPVFKLFDKSVNINDEIYEYQKKYEDVLNQNKFKEDELQKNIQDITVEEFKRKLKENIEKDVYKNLDKKILVEGLEVNTKMGADDFGSIYYIEIKQIDGLNIEPVEKVVIGGQEKSKGTVNKDKEILEFIKKNYKIKEQNIVFVK